MQDSSLRTAHSEPIPAENVLQQLEEGWTQRLPLSVGARESRGSRRGSGWGGLLPSVFTSGPGRPSAQFSQAQTSSRTFIEPDTSSLLCEELDRLIKAKADLAFQKSSLENENKMLWVERVLICEQLGVPSDASICTKLSAELQRAHECEELKTMVQEQWQDVRKAVLDVVDTLERMASSSCTTTSLQDELAGCKQRLQTVLSKTPLPDATDSAEWGSSTSGSPTVHDSCTPFSDIHGAPALVKQDRPLGASHRLSSDDTATQLDDTTRDIPLQSGRITSIF